MLRRFTFVALAVGVAVGACSKPVEHGTAQRGLLVGTERDLADRVVGPAVELQHWGTLARDGQRYFAAWSDGRRWFGGERFVTDVYATYVASDGTLSHSTGIPVWSWSDGDPSTVRDVVADCDGAGLCLVVWETETIAGKRDIRAVRVQNGQVLDTTPLALVDDMPSQFSPDVAWDGTAFRVIFSDNFGGAAIRHMKVTPQGTFDAPAKASVDNRVGGSIACGTDGGCLLVYITPTGIAGQRLDATGPVGGEFSITDAAELQHSPFAARMNDQYWVIWYDDRNRDNGDIYGARVSTTGVVADPDGVRLSAPTNGIAGHALAFDGTDVIAVWTRQPNGFEVVAARLRADGSVTDVGGAPVTPSYGTNPKVACIAGQCLAGWQDLRRDLSLRRLTGATAIDTADRALSTTPNAQEGIAAASGNGTIVAAYHDSRGLYGAVRAARVGLDGVQADVVVADATALPTGRINIRIARAAASHLVAWMHTQGIGLRTLDGDGTPTGAVKSVTGLQRWPALASDGTGYLLAWTDPMERLVGQRYDATGTPLDANPLVLATEGRYAAAGFDGTNYVVVYVSRDPTAFVPGDVSAIRVAPSGSVVGTAIPLATMPGVVEQSPAIACTSGGCYATLHRAGSGTFGVRLRDDGTLLDTTLLEAQTIAGGQSVAFINGRYLVTYRTLSKEPMVRSVALDGSLDQPLMFAPPGADVSIGAIATDSFLVVAFYDRFDDSPLARVRRGFFVDLEGSVPSHDPAGTVDAALPGTEAGVVPDASDSPPATGEGGGGCCQSSAPAPSGVASALLAGLVLLVRGRRRQR